MKIPLVFILSIVLITVSLTQVYSGIIAEPNAKVTGLYIHPETPIIDKESEITIGVRNTGDVGGSFKVKLYVLKNGIVRLGENFDIEIEAGETWMGTTEFVPKTLETLKIRAEVWDIYEFKLYNTKIIDVKPNSEFGPFDASVDIITTFPYPGKDVIALMTVVNRGMKEMDVVVNYMIQGTDVSGQYTTFLESESESSRPIFLRAPTKSGLYTLSTEVRYLDSLVASSFGQFFVSPEEYMPKLKMDGVPPVIEIEQGKSKDLSITVDNIGNDSVHDLQIITKGIPLKWLNRWPSTIYEVEPNKSRMFIVGLDVPWDAHAGEYTIEFISAAKETSIREPSSLVVLGTTRTIEEGMFKMESLIYQFLSLVIIVTVLIIMFLFTHRRKEEDEWTKLYEKWGEHKESQ